MSSDTVHEANGVTMTVGGTYTWVDEEGNKRVDTIVSMDVENDTMQTKPFDIKFIEDNFDKLNWLEQKVWNTAKSQGIEWKDFLWTVNISTSVEAVAEDERFDILPEHITQWKKKLQEMEQNIEEQIQ